MDSTAGSPARRRQTKPLRTFQHEIEVVSLHDMADNILVLMRDGRQYYRTKISKEAFQRLANQWTVDLDGDQEEAN